MKPAALLLAAFMAAAPADALDLTSDALLRDHLFKHLRSLPAGRRPKVGLVLSAGSLRGVTHVGVITVLENAGFPVDLVAGTSMGSVVGAIYAAGRPIPEMWKTATSLRASSASNLNAVSLLRLVLADKLLSSEKAAAQVSRIIGGATFDDLKKPFACVAMDLTTGEPIIFREGDVASAVRASINLPGIFEPVEYRHRYLVDGGVVAYVPTVAAKLLGADWIIASVTEPDYTRQKPKTVLDSLEQVIDIRGSLLAREQKKLANYLIEPPVGDIGMYEAGRSEEAISKGVIAAYRRLPGAIESLTLFSLDALIPDYLPQRTAP